jgi:hypothetical protein
MAATTDPETKSIDANRSGTRLGRRQIVTDLDDGSPTKARSVVSAGKSGAK